MIGIVEEVHVILLICSPNLLPLNSQTQNPEKLCLLQRAVNRSRQKSQKKQKFIKMWTNILTYLSTE